MFEVEQHAHNELVNALADWQSDWSVIEELVKPSGVALGKGNSSDSGQTAWASLIDAARAGSEETFRRLISQLEDMVSDQRVLIEKLMQELTFDDHRAKTPANPRSAALEPDRVLDEAIGARRKP